jgi:uncharacterized protein (UPF0262 family)
MTADTQRLADVVLDETIGRATPDVEHERAVAIFDLIEENSFEPVGHDKGPYKLKLSSSIPSWCSRCHSPRPTKGCHAYPVAGPFRRIVKDYFMICDSYYEAIRSSTPSQIEAIDMGGAASTMKVRKP